VNIRTWMLLIGIGLGSAGTVPAAVYLEETTRSSPFVDMLSLGDRQAGKRRIVINGMEVTADLEYSDKTTEEVIQQVANYRQTLVDVTEPVVDDDEIEQILSSFRQSYQVGGDNWSSIAWFEPAPPQQKKSGGNSYLLDNLIQGATSLVLAIDHEEGGSAIWKMHYPKIRDLFRFTFAPESDVEGQDIKGVNRFFGARRTYSFYEMSDHSQSYLVAYLGEGDLDSRQQYFVEQIKQSEYQLVRTSGHKDSMTLFASASGAELVIRSQYQTNQILDIMQLKILSAR
jgi:hypothetical protein